MSTTSSRPSAADPRPAFFPRIVEDPRLPDLLLFCPECNDRLLVLLHAVHGEEFVCPTCDAFAPAP